MTEPVSAVPGLAKLLVETGKSTGFFNAYFLAKRLRENRRLDMLADFGLVRQLNPGKEIRLEISDGNHSVTVVGPAEDDPHRRVPVPARLHTGTDAAELASDPGVRVWETFTHTAQREQESIDAVLEHAGDEVIRQAEEGVEANEHPVDETWMARFFDSARLIRDEEMRQVWGRLLGAEVVRPGSISPQTIRALETVSGETARLFHRVSSKVLWYASIEIGAVIPERAFLFTGRSAVDPVPHLDMLALQEAGLVAHTHSSLTIVSAHSEGDQVFHSSGIDLLVKTDGSAPKDVKRQAYFLTRAGMEVLRVASVETRLPYLIEVADSLAGQGVVVRVFSGIEPTQNGVRWSTLHHMSGDERATSRA